MEVKEYPKPVVRPVETPDECLVAEICIDEYLWSLYERTPKIDTNKVTEQIKTTVKKKGKTRTVIKTITKYVVGDFTWKDPIAAQRAGMSLKDYVIGGMDRGFKLKLYHALRAMDDAGLMPGITSAFRDDYRQSIASGNKAASDSSYHGGSRRGGYGHGLAADLVSVKGETRVQRYASSEELWKWIDAHEKELGIGRPYLDRDPPHVAPIDGKEYADKRGRANSATRRIEKDIALIKSKVNLGERWMSAGILRRIMRFSCSLILAALAICLLSAETPSHARSVFWSQSNFWWGDYQFRHKRQHKHTKTDLTKKHQFQDASKGPLQIIISIADQRISLYENGGPDRTVFGIDRC